MTLTRIFSKIFGSEAEDADGHRSEQYECEVCGTNVFNPKSERCPNCDEGVLSRIE